MSSIVNYHLLVTLVISSLLLLPITVCMALIHKWRSGLRDHKLAAGIILAVTWFFLSISTSVFPGEISRWGFSKFALLAQIMLYIGIAGDWIFYVFKTRFFFWRTDAIVLLNVLVLIASASALACYGEKA
ncbi:hypothetical protein [Tritonibacter mobilis]|uniref:hypothetical protein n=1 Tax=Tritonibacter mobilis TaxID=379347 RepID=UPI001402ED46|nr:hypothetical protein [Tritonibacter mobilis]NHM21537.1 hypothetical protein [Tritonibacter mobilis]